MKLNLPPLDRSLFKREFIAALTTFLTMSYIVVVNPAILSVPGTGLPFEGVLTATVVLIVSCTLLMGAYAGLPYAVAPGMGINAFFTYSLVLGKNIPWPTALGMVFWSGVLFLILSVTPIRAVIVQSLPNSVRQAAAVGIGLFLAFIGFKNAGIIIVHPETFVTFGSIGLEQVLTLIGLFIAIYLLRKKSPFAFLGTIFTITIASLFLGKAEVPETLVSTPDFTSVFFKMDIWDSLQLVYLPPILSIMFTDLFDSLSTFVGLAQTSNLVDKEGQPLRMREGLIVDAWATGLAGVFGTSSGTAYIESAAGVEAGGRTGWTAIFIALLFLPCLFIAPLVKMVPAIATAPVLIVVGFMMFSHISEITKGSIEETFPAFLTVILIPLTFSITEGLLWGIVSYMALHVMVGKAKTLPKGLYVVSALCMLLLWIQSHS